MKKIIYTLLISIGFMSCTQKPNPFLITKNRIGKLHKNAIVAQLDSIYSTDSIVNRIGEGDYVQASDDAYLIYEKGGKHLLTLTPIQQHDSLEPFKTIQIFDSRFKTEKGITLSSTFKDIKDNYTIYSIQNTIYNAVVFVYETDAYFTIDKKELSEEFQNNVNIKIDEIQIPDTAKIKYFMLDWNKE